MNIIFAIVLFAQMLNPQAAVQAYTTADPNNPDRLGLATQDGRFAITLMQNCDGITDGQNILIYPAYQLPPWLTISTLDGSTEGGCIVRVEGRMDNTPCFTNTDGVCDIAAESD